MNDRNLIFTDGLYTIKCSYRYAPETMTFYYCGKLIKHFQTFKYNFSEIMQEFKQYIRKEITRKSNEQITYGFFTDENTKEYVYIQNLTATQGNYKECKTIYNMIKNDLIKKNCVINDVCTTAELDEKFNAKNIKNNSCKALINKPLKIHVIFDKQI